MVLYEDVHLSVVCGGKEFGTKEFRATILGEWMMWTGRKRNRPDENRAPVCGPKDKKI